MWEVCSFPTCKFCLFPILVLLFLSALLIPVFLPTIGIDRPIVIVFATFHFLFGEFPLKEVLSFPVHAVSSEVTGLIVFLSSDEFHFIFVVFPPPVFCVRIIVVSGCILTLLAVILTNIFFYSVILSFWTLLLSALWTFVTLASFACGYFSFSFSSLIGSVLVILLLAPFIQLRALCFRSKLIFLVFPLIDSHLAFFFI